MNEPKLVFRYIPFRKACRLCVIYSNIETRSRKFGIDGGSTDGALSHFLLGTGLALRSNIPRKTLSKHHNSACLAPSLTFPSTSSNGLAGIRGMLKTSKLKSLSLMVTERCEPITI